jgi:hypothetical protein
MNSHTHGASGTAAALTVVLPQSRFLSKREDYVNRKLLDRAIYLNEKELLGILPARMPGGTREERLRTWVSKRLQRRGVGAALARHLGKPQAWVTMYSARARDADLDTSIKIAEFFNVPLAAIVGEVDLPDEEQPADQGLSEKVERAIEIDSESLLQIVDAWPALEGQQRELLSASAAEYLRVSQGSGPGGGHAQSSARTARHGKATTAARRVASRRKVGSA